MATRTIEEARAEAMKRLKALKAHENVLKEFEEEGKLNKSGLGGILHGLDDNEQEMVKTFEEEHDVVVYHLIHQRTGAVEMYSLLYVSLDDEEWELDMDDLEAGQAFVYVVSKTVPEFSEFVSIGIKPCTGGIIRTW